MNDFGIATKKEIGRRLLAARVKKGLTTIDVAKAVDTRDATISRWENGLNEGRCREVTRTGMFLGISPDELLLESKGENRPILENADEELLAEILAKLVRIRQLAPYGDRNPLVSIRNSLANVLNDFAPRDTIPEGTVHQHPEPGVKTMTPPPSRGSRMRKDVFGQTGTAGEASAPYGLRKRKRKRKDGEQPGAN